MAQIKFGTRKNEQIVKFLQIERTCPQGLLSTWRWKMRRPWLRKFSRFLEIYRMRDNGSARFCHVNSATQIGVCNIPNQRRF